jgi:phosphatidylglycerol:prolipoprotein diacylglycerol transferase
MFLAIRYPSWIHPEIFPGVPFLHIVRWYGLMYLFAFATAYLVFKRLARQGYFDAAGGQGGGTATDDDIVSCFTWGIIFLLIGARVFSAFVYDSTSLYMQKPWLIFWPFADGCRFTGLAGMSYHGGFIGGLIGMIAWCAVKKKPLLPWIDAMSIAIPAGYSWGRLGNFLNGELFGRVTSSPWGMVFPNARRFSYDIDWVKTIADAAGIAPAAGSGLVNLPRHPSQLYEMFFEGIAVFAILWCLWRFYVRRNGKPFDGVFACLYTALYGTFRFFIEYFREPDAELGYRIARSASEPTHLNVSLTNISTGQILCAAMILSSIVAGAVLFALKKKKSGVS